MRTVSYLRQRLLVFALAAVQVLSLASLALAQGGGGAGVPPDPPAGKSYAVSYGAVLLLLAVGLILICKSSNRAKDPPVHIDED